MSIAALNFTLQDILGAAFAFCLFPLVIVFPGYVAGWVFNCFDFRIRQPVVRLGIGIVLSFAISPILFFLTSNFFPKIFTLLILAGIALAFTLLLFRKEKPAALVINSQAKYFYFIGAAWAVIAILSLVDIQWKDQLFLSVASYDQTTRVSVVDAITRTGVPPINPTYYPGGPVKLTFLYYFWYILCSVIDSIGGPTIDARAALNASSAWSGIGLMALIALYLRQRNSSDIKSAWRSARIGVILLAVSGLDVIPIAVLVARMGKIVGSIDVWNTPISAWAGSNLWVPHHIASMIAGVCAVMLAQSARKKTPPRQFAILTLAGLAFASALGLSVWITLVFVVFWGTWMTALIFQKTERSLILPMIYAGLMAVLLASPFLIEIFKGGSGGQSPVLFEVRTLFQLESFVRGWPAFARSLIMLAFLPINYLLEFGFYFMACLFWLKGKDIKILRSNPFFLGEALLLAVVILMGSFLSSALTTSNDFGWRAWLAGQFVLLIWGVDIVEKLVLSPIPANHNSTEARKNRSFLIALIVIGSLTSVMDLV